MPVTGSTGVDGAGIGVSAGFWCIDAAIVRLADIYRARVKVVAFSVHHARWQDYLWRQLGDHDEIIRFENIALQVGGNCIAG